MIWVQFAATALVIVLAGVRLARYGDVLGEKSGLGRSCTLGGRERRGVRAVRGGRTSGAARRKRRAG